jgi:4'-phosphopantetheinyl transferase
VRPIAEADRIAERVFSSLERETLRSLPASERLTAFFTCWTLEEAYAKGLSQGLSLRLNAFDVPLRPGDASRSSGRWLQAFSPRPGYQAALAAEGLKCEWQRRTWSWS